MDIPSTSILSLPSEQLNALIEATSSAAHSILQSYADDLDHPTNWRTVLSFRLRDGDLFQIQRNGCEPAVILVNGNEFLTLDRSDKPRVNKFKLAALRAIKLAATLSRAGSALITGDLAYAITKERKRVRREILGVGYNALDERYFSLSGTLILTDKLGGRTLSAEIIPFIPLESQVNALRHHLSLLMLQDSETEEMIDILEMARSYKKVKEEPPVSYILSNDDTGGMVTHVDYRESSLLPTEI